MADIVDAPYVKDHVTDGWTTLVNVLSREDYERQHIPGSRNVPVEEPGFDERIQELVADKGRPVIVHCSSNTCPASTKAAKRMEELGYTQVQEFKAGIQGWQEAGYPIESSYPLEPSGATRPERPGRGRKRLRAEEVGETPPT